MDRIKKILINILEPIFGVFTKLKKTSGLWLTIIIIAIPSFAWVIGYDFSGMSGLEIAGTILKRGAAFAGMAMFAWTLILSGRYKILDGLFNGLDQTYIAHRFLGTTVMALLILHPFGYTLLHIAAQGATGLTQHFLGFESIALTMGRLSLYGLILLGIWSVFAKVKHETFIKVHLWLGVLFVAGAAHAFMSGPESVLANNAFMFWYMLILSTTATLTFLHYSIFGDFLHPYYKYKVASVNVLPGDVVDIELTPKYRIVNFKPGQFFYVAFDQMGEDRYHPYSVASSKDSSKMRFLVKKLGDYTNQLDELSVGTVARLKGPYGGFTFDDDKHAKQLWLAGGIGVTPFLSKAHSLRFSQLHPEVKMFHFAKDKQEAIDREVLNIIQKDHKAFDYKCIPEDKFGIVSLKDISKQLGSLKDYAIYLCGPPAMLKAYDEQAKELNIEKQLHYEEFSY